MLGRVSVVVLVVRFSRKSIFSLELASGVRRLRPLCALCAPFALKAKRNVNQLQMMIVVVSSSRHDQYTVDVVITKVNHFVRRGNAFGLHKVETDTDIFVDECGD